MRATKRQLPGTVRHPLFAVLWKVMVRNQSPEVTEHRRRTLAGLSGRVIEVGAGTGTNFRYYPDTVTEVLAVEPEPSLRAQAERAAAAARVVVRVVDGTAERLPAETGEFDAGVASLVLCSVRDQMQALEELHRVIRPGGELRYYEHILSPRSGLARAQRILDYAWPRAFGNCHTARDTETCIHTAGFMLEESERFWAPPCSIAAPIGPHVIGLARRPA